MFAKNKFFQTISLALVFVIAISSSNSIPVNAMPLAVVDPPGTLDATFDGDGLVTTSIGSFNESARAIALQPDGKLVITGNFSENFDQGWNNFFLARYNSDGSLDNTFDLDGKVTGFWGNESATGTLAIQEDGKIIVAGYTSVGSFLEAELALARFNSDGSLDTSFDMDGKVITNLGSGYDYASDVVIQADGKIVVAGVRQIGANDNDIVLLRYNTNGSLDSSFNTDGIVSTSVGNIDFAGSIVIQPDGRFVVGGSTDKNGDQLDFNLLRYNTDGSLDSSFGTAGIVITDFGIGGSSDQGGFIALQPDGKTITAGFNLDGYFLLARYNTDGSLDTTFNSDGLVSTYSGRSSASIQGLALQSNGKIVIAGSSGPNNDFAIARYSDNGFLDMSFDGDGMVFTDFGINKNDQARAVIVQPDGKIVAAGDRDGSSNYDIALARYIGDEPPQTRYVKLGTGGDNNGTSWENAYTDLQSALAAATSGDEIWVAAGTYKPTTGTDRTVSFALKNGVSIYGGFTGTETSLSQRNIETNITVLSGDIGITGNNSDNSYHVVVGSGTNNSAILDGFTITAGNANGDIYEAHQLYGGGMFNYLGSPTLRNVIFSANSALLWGGGLYNLGDYIYLQNVGSNPILTNVVFTGNSATEGGGMRNAEYSSPVLNNVTFSNNTASRSGGGMENINYSNPILNNVTFDNNAIPASGGTSTFNAGGAIMNWGSSSPALTNVTITSNSAINEGGGIYNAYGSNPILKNVTLSNNSANQGGGLYNASGSNPVIVNSIFYGNSGGQIYDESDTKPVTYSIVQGGYTGIGNLDADPLLVSLANNGGFTETMALGVGSPAINTGTNIGCPATDQRGVTRPQNGQCDIGAYEVTPPMTRYVKWNASGANDGSSWANAYIDLQTALAFASSGDQIWVAAGTYKPTTGTDRSISFTLENGVAVYGGFAGNEVSLTQRDPANNVTILSGDISVTGNDSDNSYHVVIGSSTNNSAILDGFTITAGNANADMSYQTGGGGIFNYIGSPSLTNLKIVENYGYWGGGMYNLGEAIFLPNEGMGSNPILTNVVFSNNSASEGGGIRNEFHSNPILTNVVFRNNTASRASGGMHNGTYSSPTLTNGLFEGNVGGLGPGGLGNFVSNAVLTNVTFKDNTATMFGGGVVNNSGIQTFTNVTFSGNSAEFGGGMWNSDTSPTLTNVTFKNNSASTAGGGIYSEDTTNMVMRNTILWGNTAPTSPQIHNDNSVATISDSFIQDGFAGGTNIITVDPLLGPLADNGGFTQTMALLPGSPAIDAGTNAGCPETDQRGVKRPQGGQCDIGAYEYRSDATFGDVPWDHWAWSYIEALYNAGVTSGCSISPKLYCPTTTVTRDQMAVFLLKAKYGSGHIPPTPIGVFLDVPTDYWAAPWIEELAAEGITSGCSVSPKLYCPTTTVTRDQMAVFLLKAEHGSGYTPPTPTGVFEDVITDYWAASWIERLAAEGITGGCSVTPKWYCPATPVSRDQMAIFLDKTFGIPLLP